LTLQADDGIVVSMEPEMNRQFRALFDAHDEAIRALRAANTQMGHAIQSHDEAIEGALRANRAAIDLLRQLDKNNQG